MAPPAPSTATAATPTHDASPRATRSKSARTEAVRLAGDLLDRLRLLVHYAPSTPRAIERRAGFSRGYLSQILAGNLHLRVEHLLAVVLALDLDPAEFFDGLFTDRRYRPRRSDDAPPRRDATQALSLELAKRYGVGLDSLDDLLRRLETYEASLRRLESSDNSLAGPRSSASLCDG